MQFFSSSFSSWAQRSYSRVICLKANKNRRALNRRRNGHACHGGRSGVLCQIQLTRQLLRRIKTELASLFIRHLFTQLVVRGPSNNSCRNVTICIAGSDEFSVPKLDTLPFSQLWIFHKATALLSSIIKFEFLPTRILWFYLK